MDNPAVITDTLASSTGSTIVDRTVPVSSALIFAPSSLPARNSCSQQCIEVREPTLAEMFDDPIVRLVIDSDRLSPAEVWAHWNQVRQQLLEIAEFEGRPKSTVERDKNIRS
jgi:hypothetical protein